MSLEVKEVSGGDLEPHLDDLGRLRIAVFREWPYLYEGTLDYEREYLTRYLRCPRSKVALVFDGQELVGATTAMPMEEEEAEFRQPFANAGYEVSSILYLGESILLPAYRGRGLGKQFFAIREAHAKTLGSRWTTFCAVDRSTEDPRRPANYRPLDALWSKQGYTRRPELQTTFEWKEIGEEAESPKTLTFWTKEWPR